MRGYILPVYDVWAMPFGRCQLGDDRLGDAVWAMGRLGDGTYGRQDVWAMGHLGDAVWATGRLGDGTYGRQDVWAMRCLGDETFGRFLS